MIKKGHDTGKIQYFLTDLRNFVDAFQMENVFRSLISNMIAIQYEIHLYIFMNVKYLYRYNYLLYTINEFVNLNCENINGLTRNFLTITKQQRIYDFK